MYNMNSRQLQYVTTVAEIGSISAAAQKLYISQPSLSQYIQKIEAELGIELFERTSPLRLTTAGHVYVETAKNILLEQAELEKVINDIKDYQYGTLVIGTTPYCAAWILPPVIKEFHKCLPQIQIIMREGIEKILPQRAAVGEFDFVISSYPLSDREFVTEDLLSEDFVIAVPMEITSSPEFLHVDNIHEHPAVDLKQLGTLPFISMDNGFYLDMVVKRILKKSGVTPKIVARCSSMTTIYRILKTNIGISILPECMTRGFSPDITYLHIQGNDERRSVKLSYRQTQYFSGAAKKFVEVFGEVWSGIE